MIRWLVVGAGQAGRCHITAIQRTHRAVLAGIVDPYGDQDFDAPVFDGLGQAISTVKPDAVIIAAPNDTQVALARMALDKGLPVLCEKPVGLSRADAEAVRSHAKASGLPIGVVLNQRAQDHSRWIKALIAAGKLKPKRITFTGDVTRLMGWHRDPDRSGGGALRTIGIHFLDLLLWWLGPTQGVQARIAGAPQQEETFNVTLSFPNDCLARVKIDAIKEQGTGPVQCVIEGEGSRIEMAGHAIITVTGLPDPPTTEPYDPALFFGPGHHTLVAEATDSLSRSEGFPFPLDEVFPVLTLIEDIYATASD